MIDRYCTPEMNRIMSEQNKFEAWKAVEFAIIQAKVHLGIYPQEALEIKTKAQICPDRLLTFASTLNLELHKAEEKGEITKKFKEFLRDKIYDFVVVERIKEIERDTGHDMAAFIQAVQESLPEYLRKYFHADITSYDVEEPAFSLRAIEALKIIEQALRELIDIVRLKVLQYKDLARIERSHGQHAEPNTLGLMFLGWYDALKRQIPFIGVAQHDMCYSKISGAVGTYTGNLSPELEKHALKLLGLEPVRFATQIVMRDRHANVLNALAVLAAVIEHMALNIRLLGQTEVGELEEPFGKKQKGSSRMPHKKNTILSENLCGLSRVVRTYHSIALENIPTWGARDISQSAPERIIFPDSFQLVHFMLKRMKKIMEGLVVDEKNIKRNLEMTNYVFFSPEIKELLLEHFEPEAAYRITQQAAFETQRERTPEETLPDDVFVSELMDIEEIIDSNLMPSDFRKVFDMRTKLKDIDKIFERFNCLI